MRTTPRAVAAAIAIATTAAGCNLLFGIHEGEPTGSTSSSASSGATTSTASGSGGSTTSSSTTGTTTSSSSSTTTTGTGGAGGAGGTGGCNVYAGDGMVTATNTGSANIATTTIYASGSVSGSYHPPSDTTEFSVGGGAAGAACDIGFRVALSKHVVMGKTYTLVSEATFNSPAFDLGAHAYVDLIADLTCTPPAPKEFQSIDGAAGTVKVTSVTTTSVALSFTGVEVTGVTNAMASGTGKLVLDGTAHSDCFGF